MDLNQLIEELTEIRDKDPKRFRMCVIGDSNMWCNIDGIVENGSEVKILMEESPVFDN